MKRKVLFLMVATGFAQVVKKNFIISSGHFISNKDSAVIDEVIHVPWNFGVELVLCKPGGMSQGRVQRLYKQGRISGPFLQWLLDRRRESLSSRDRSNESKNWKP